MEQPWKNRSIAATAIVSAVMFGSAIASENFVFALVTLAALAALLISWLSGGILASIILSATLVGYLVGNRGFAQASLLGSIPLLPAEFALACCLVLLFFQGAIEHRWPIGRDWLSLGILFWCAISAIRLGPDLQTYGAFALRDFATVYYALFYFVAYFLSWNPKSRALIVAGIGLGTIFLPPFFFASRAFPEPFLHFTYRGIPLILYKPDLASAFAAVGTIWCYARSRSASYAMQWVWRLALVMNLALIGTAVGRATMLSLAVATVLFLLAKERRFATQLIGIGLALAIISTSVDIVRGQHFAQTKVYSIYEHLISITDLRTQGEYEAALDSADNNRFRLVWWKLVVSETLEKAPLVGQGWGYDLGAHFAQAYFGTRPDDFTARSPHNIFITLFGRTGFVGFAAFSVVVLSFGRRVSQIVRAYPQGKVGLETLGLWIAVVVIFVCACLGVVLEGPMGAIIFWTLLGIGNADIVGHPGETHTTSEDTDSMETETEVSPPQSGGGMG